MEPRLSLWLYHLIVGQLLAILLTGTGICAANLAALKPNSNYPALLAFLNYCLCSTYLLRPFIFNGSGDTGVGIQQEGEVKGGSGMDDEEQKHESYQGAADSNIAVGEPQSTMPQGGSDVDGCCCPDLSKMALPKPGERLPSVWWYVMAAIIDLQANFLIIWSYSYTNMTSVAIIDSFSIPAVMLISFSLLRSRYQLRHYLGVFLCIVGVLGIIFNDRFVKKSRTVDEEESSFVGDLMAMSGAFLYACSNVLQEKMVKYGVREQYIGRIGLFGMGFAAIQFFSIEFQDFEQAAPLPSEAGLYMVGFVLCLFFFYTNTSQFLTQNDAVLFNLSLCASDIYSVAYAYFAFGTMVNWLYIICAALIFGGIFLYHSERPPQKQSMDTTVAVSSSTGGANAGTMPPGSSDGDDEIVARRERGHLEAAFSYNPLGDTDEEPDPQYRF